MKLRHTLVAMTSASILLLSSFVVAQQSVEENVKPVSSVCLAGQSCVGNASGAASSAPAAAPAAVAVAAPAAEPAPAPAEPAPVAAAPATAAFDPAAAYQMSCFACHASGAAGAPKLGDTAAWTARLEKGMDAVMTVVVNGLNAMPPKGMCMTCSDDELRAIVDYMVSQ